MSRSLAQRIAILVVLIALVSAVPAVAGGTPYDAYRWAGIRAAGWQSDNGSRPPPTQVEAQWNIPCLSRTDPRYGAYDQWIGIEGTANTLIQVGVRSYHIYTGFGAVTGYFAWVVNTRDATLRTPKQLYRIYNCGLDESGGNVPATIYAGVRANGQVYINTTNAGNPVERTSYSASLIGIAAPESPRWGTFVLERFTSSAANTLPWFGRAAFHWCKVQSGNSGGYLGDPKSLWSPTSMLSYQSGVAVQSSGIVPGGDGQIHGDFTFTQFRTY